MTHGPTDRAADTVGLIPLLTYDLGETYLGVARERGHEQHEGILIGLPTPSDGAMFVDMQSC
jgi:hypothetical protein